MAPKLRYSNLANNYPSFQKLSPMQVNCYRWMECRQSDDNAEGLWRIHDKLYELSSFVEQHPGGADWIRMTKGTDITESFEVHHIRADIAEKRLSEFYVREARKSRNVKLTFHPDGFYRTLKSRVANAMQTIDRSPEKHTKMTIDGLLLISTVLLIAAARLHNYAILLLASLFVSWTIIAAHNFFHRRDNFRMYYFNFMLLSYREWRIQHSLSHHLYPNSLLDLEVTLFEPFLCWATGNAKSVVQRYGSWLYSPVVYMVLFIVQFLTRVVFSVMDKTNLFYRSDALPFAVPLVMYIVGGSDVNLSETLKMWLIVVLASSFYFGLVGINAGHHTDHSVHDGDELRDNLDWGLYTLDSIADNLDLRKVSFLGLVSFGHHAMHHLFPTIDHGLLPELYPILYKTMDEYDTHLEEFPWLLEFAGQFKQLARVKPTDYATRVRLRIEYFRNSMS